MRERVVVGARGWGFDDGDFLGAHESEVIGGERLVGGIKRAAGGACADRKAEGGRLQGGVGGRFLEFFGIEDKFSRIEIGFGGQDATDDGDIESLGFFEMARGPRFEGRGLKRRSGWVGCVEFFFGGEGFNKEENIHRMGEGFAFFGGCGGVGFGEDLRLVERVGLCGVVVGVEIGFVGFDVVFGADLGVGFGVLGCVVDKEGDIFGGHEGAMRAGLFGSGKDIGWFELANGRKRIRRRSIGDLGGLWRGGFGGEWGWFERRGLGSGGGHPDRRWLHTDKR